MHYFIGKNGKQLGPFTSEQVRTKLSSGEVNYEDLGWHDGLSEWKPLRILFSPLTSSPFAPIGVHRSSTPFKEAFAAATEPTEYAPVLAGRFSRLGAYMLDQLFLLLLAAPGLWLLLKPFIADIAAGKTVNPNQILANILPVLPFLAIPILAFMVLQIVLLAKRGQTLGKMLLNVRIVRLDGTKADIMHVFLIRTMVPTLIGFIPMVGGLFGLIDVLLIFREDRRCIHDLMAGTIVVDA